MNARQARADIVRCYRRATYCYAAPFVLLVLGGALLPEGGLVGLYLFVPAGVAGLYFTWRGRRLAASSNDLEKKDVGYANLLLGILVVVLGLFGLALAGLMVAAPGSQ